MKNFIFLTIFLAFSFVMKSQEDISVGSSEVSPAPTFIGLEQEMCFFFSATNGVNLNPSETIRLDVSFQKVSNESVADLEIDSPDFITWTFFPFLLSWQGVINTDLPDLTSVEVCFSGLIVNDEATVSEASNQQGVGFQVNLVPHSGDNGLDDNITFNYTFTDASVLPIELGDFIARAENTDGILEWTTISEQNNSHFEIERSKDGVNFEFVSVVNSKAIGGNSDVQLDYMYIDKDAAAWSELVYYRIKQVDRGVNPNFAFTQVRIISFEDVIIGSKIFPNPVIAGDAVIVQSNNIERIEVYNTNGEIVNVIEENGVRSTSISTSQLAKGLYIVVINNKEELKFVVQ